MARKFSYSPTEHGRRRLYASIGRGFEEAETKRRKALPVVVLQPRDANEYARKQQTREVRIERETDEAWFGWPKSLDGRPSEPSEYPKYAWEAVRGRP